MIQLDTSVLVDALSGQKRSAPAVRAAIQAGDRLTLSTLALFEWLRGPRREVELAAQEVLLPSASAVPFGPEEARRAAALYRRVSRPRGREIDLAIAACAITHRARLWTLNVGDFSDIPDLELYAP